MHYRESTWFWIFLMTWLGVALYQRCRFLTELQKRSNLRANKEAALCRAAIEKLSTRLLFAPGQKTQDSSRQEQHAARLRSRDGAI